VPAHHGATLGRSSASRSSHAKQYLNFLVVEVAGEPHPPLDDSRHGRGTARTETPISPDAAPILMSREHFVIQLLSDIRTRGRDAARRTVARIARNERNSGSCNKGSLERERRGRVSPCSTRDETRSARGARPRSAIARFTAGSSHRVTT